MNQWKRKFESFMKGRNGIDDLGIVLISSSLVLLLISIAVHGLLLSLIAYGLLIYAYYRVLSRKLEKRRRENMDFLAEKEHVRFKWQTRKLHRSMRKTHRYLKCKKCGKRMRVPKGKGKIEITCPHCGEKFIKRT